MSWLRRPCPQESSSSPSSTQLSTFGDQIHDQPQTATSVAVPGVDDVIEVSLDRATRFALYVLVDSFLFESVSIRDTLFQFVNIRLRRIDGWRKIATVLRQSAPVAA